MKISLRSIDEVKPYAKNPRLNDKAVASVAASLREFGFRKPIVVDKKGVIVCGHTCFKAAQSLGLQRVPVHVADELTPKQIRAYRLADNRTSDIAEWDYDLLKCELADLESAGFDLSTLGWNEIELAGLIAAAGGEGLTDPNEIPAAPAKAVTEPGELITLGNHRLLCGDSSMDADVAKLLAGAVIDLVNMDPPYNVNVEPRSNNAIAAGKAEKTATHHQSFDAARRPSCKKPTDAKLRPKDRVLKNDFLPEAEFDRLLAAWFTLAAKALKPGGAFYIWGGYANCANYPPAMKRAALYFAQAIIWVKEHPVLTRKDFMGDHEWCFYGWKEGGAHKFYGPHNVTDVWSVKKVPHTQMVHLTEKPVELAKRAIEYSSRPGERVMDFFGGSGSTLIAAEQTGRRAYLMELDPLYCDVIVERWEKFTGKKAKRGK